MHERLRVANSSASINAWKARMTFLLYLVVEIGKLVNEISSFPKVLYEKGDLKNFSKFTDKHKKQPSGGVSV